MDLDITRSLWTVPQPLQNDDPLPSLKTHASNVTAPNTLLSTAPLTNAGDVIGLPLDITNTNAQNIQRISLMFSKTASIMTITYLLTQITTYPANAESPIH